MQTLQGVLLLALQRMDEAEALYRSLLAVNPNNYKYHEGLQVCVLLWMFYIGRAVASTPRTVAF